MYSQYEEEKIIQEFFGEGFVGRFLDLGAGDGVLGSNTRALFERGWSGWLVEPHPSSFMELFQVYKDEERATLIHAALSGHGQPVQFFHAAGQLSTACAETPQLSHMRGYFMGSYWIPTLTPNELLRLLGGTQIDFVSLDCEGLDQEIADQGVDLLQNVRLLCYESDRPGCTPDPFYTAQWRDLREKLGFKTVVARTHGNTLVAR